MGELVNRAKLPRVLGELLAGIIVGPSLLGLVSGNSELEALALLGMVFFMFSAGLEVELDKFIHALKGGLLVAVCGVVVPFTLGYLVGTAFGLDFVQCFCLGTCLSITAIGLSIRVLMDLGVLTTRPGMMVVDAAVIDDIIGLALLVVALSLAEAGTIDAQAVLWIGVSVVAFVFSCIIVSRALQYVYRAFSKCKSLREGHALLSTVIITMLVFGLLAKFFGLHEVLGVFIGGMLLRSVIREDVRHEILDFTFAFFALLFFAYVGVMVDLRVLATSLDLAAAVIGAAIAGKVIGGFVGAIASGLSAKESLMIGVAMNARAAVELSIATILYTMGVFGQELFSAVVLMAAATSLLTPILLRLVVKYVAPSLTPLRAPGKK